MDGKDEFQQRMNSDPSAMILFKPIIIKLYTAWRRPPNDREIRDWSDNLKSFDKPIVQLAVNELISTGGDFMPNLSDLIRKCREVKSKLIAKCKEKNKPKMPVMRLASREYYLKRFGPSNYEAMQLKLKELTPEDKESREYPSTRLEKIRFKKLDN